MLVDGTLFDRSEKKKHTICLEAGSVNWMQAILMDCKLLGCSCLQDRKLDGDGRCERRMRFEDC